MKEYQPTKDELAIINERFAKQPYTSPSDLYAFPAMIIDNRMTAYFTRVHPDFLQQCVKDLINGVGFLVGHDKDKLPMARSFKGQLTSDGDIMEVFAKFFMQKNLEINGINTDDFMRAFLGGTIEDVSIGFAAKRYECNICGNDIRTMDCPHWPGKKYNDKDEEDEKGVLCFAWIKEPAGPDGEALLEVSAVYKGAAPKAKQKRPSEVPKFTLNLSQGKDLKEMPADVPIAINFSFSFSDEFERGKGTDTEGGGKKMIDVKKFLAKEYTEKELKESTLTLGDVDKILEKIVSSGEKLKVAETNNKVLLEQVGGFKTEIEGHKQELQEVKDSNVASQGEISSLKLTVEDGRLYREDLIKEILGLGIKLHGNSFDKETNETMLREPTRKLSEIKSIREQYVKELDEKFPRKQTSVNDLKLGESGEEIPDEAFKQE